MNHPYAAVLYLQVVGVANPYNKIASVLHLFIKLKNIKISYCLSPDCLVN